MALCRARSASLADNYRRCKEPRLTDEKILTPGQRGLCHVHCFGPCFILFPPPSDLVGDTVIVPHCVEEETEARRDEATCPRKLGRRRVRIKTPVHVSVPLLSAQPNGHSLANSYSSFKAPLKHRLCSEAFPSASCIPSPCIWLPMYCDTACWSRTASHPVPRGCRASLCWECRGQHWPRTLPSRPTHSQGTCFAASVLLAGNKSSNFLWVAPSPTLVEPRPRPTAGGGVVTQSDQSVQSMLLFSKMVQEVGLWRLNYLKSSTPQTFCLMVDIQ